MDCATLLKANFPMGSFAHKSPCLVVTKVASALSGGHVSKSFRYTSFSWPLRKPTTLMGSDRLVLESLEFLGHHPGLKNTYLV